jgi:DNA-binding NtrC family response regulator
MSTKRSPESSEETTQLSQRTPRGAPLEVCVRACCASASPGSFRLEGGTRVIGSAPDCDMVVIDPTVSRRHVELAPAPEGVAIRDLGSTNGTFYLGSRVDKITLRVGAQFTLGDAVTISIEADAGSLADVAEYPGDSYRCITGASSAMRRLFGVLKRLEGSLVPVLVEGESGVGKELIARALHEGSAVAGGALIVVNCGAIAKELVTSELFGHKKGAFTGALEVRRGAFESADGGTLFLDEVAELPLEVQPMLLRALESGEIRSVGSDEVRKVKVRLIAATNRDVAADVDAGKFRQDLFYRLAVVRVRVPALRERPDDIAPLAQRFARDTGLGELSPEVVAELRTRTFPGNARELRNVVQAYGALGVLPDPNRPAGAMLEAALDEFVDVTRPYSAQKDALTDRFTRLYLERVLEYTSGNRSAAARIAGLDRTYLSRLLAKHGPGRP